MIQRTLKISLKASQIVRLVATCVFLVVGLAGSYITLSIQKDINASLDFLDYPLPLWLANATEAEGRMFPVDTSFDEIDIEAIGQALPASDWSPVLSLMGMVDLALMEDQDGRRYMIRSKTIAYPSFLSIMHVPLVAGAIPPEDEWKSQPRILVSEEVAETLFQGSSKALGQEVYDHGHLLQKCVIAGVYRNPSEFQIFLGVPDVLILPTEALFQRLTTEEGTNRLSESFAFSAESLSPQDLEDTVVPRLRARHPDLRDMRFWQGASSMVFSPSDLRQESRYAKGIMQIIGILSAVFLVVSCLSVLSYMFISVTSQAREIALKRALGRDFGSFALSCFLQGCVMVFLAAFGAFLIARASLPSLSQGLSFYLGHHYSRSSGLIRLDYLSALCASAGAALLSGLMAMLPLLPYKNLALSTQLKEEL